MSIKRYGYVYTLVLLLLAATCAFFGFGGYFPGGAPAAQVLFYILLTLAFIASLAALIRRGSRA